MARLQEIGIDDIDIRIIKEMKQKQAEIRIDGDQSTETFGILNGVRQGYVLSPILFNVYVEKVFQLALKNESRGIKVILANNFGDLQSINR